MPEDASADPVDADVGTVNGCTTFEDLTGADANRTIIWIRTVGQKCLQVKAGQSVVWDPQQTFEAHPLRPTKGSPESPIAKQESGGARYTVIFPKAGIFGFICGFHFDMTGAIKVVD